MSSKDPPSTNKNCVLPIFPHPFNTFTIFWVYLEGLGKYVSRIYGCVRWICEADGAMG